jgi:deoxyribodipyrimidine photo-lyase
MTATLLPNPSGDSSTVVQWVDTHLGHLTLEGPGGTFASGRFRGGQAAADAALDGFDVRGYAGRRSEVLPRSKRGASGLSPYIRHGLLALSDVWAHTAKSGAPKKDIEKFHDELLWQEYSRHLYARLGTAMSRPLRGVPRSDGGSFDPWDRSMACMTLVLDELEGDGWAVNQTRMWMASQWNVRHGVDWRDGEDRFFAHLLDGSRAANRAGWQWTIGSGNGKPYGFSRWQVEKRAPGTCDGCVHRRSCPIQEWPDSPEWLPRPAETHPRIGRDGDPGRTGGPAVVDRVDAVRAEAVWVTAESLGLGDPAMAANPDLPLVFVFDEPLLRQLQLSSKRLVFLAETLAELSESAGPLEVHLGSPATVLAGRPVATTFAPVPGWRRRAGEIRPVEVHPWPWLRQPGSGSVQSFSSWQSSVR